jgi:hypothetical protein
MQEYFKSFCVKSPFNSCSMEVVMKKPIMVLLLSAAAATACAESQEFSEVDANQDGALSTTEAQQALPEIAIVDTNSDGMLNQAEAEAALPELVLSGEAETKEAGLIGEAEYQMIVQVLADTGKRSG